MGYSVDGKWVDDGTNLSPKSTRGLDMNDQLATEVADAVNPKDAVNLDTLLDNIGVSLNYWLSNAILTTTLTDSEASLQETPSSDPETLTTITFKSTVIDTPTPFELKAGSIVAIHFSANVTSTAGKHIERLKFQLGYVDADGTSNFVQIGGDSDLTSALIGVKTEYESHIHVAADIEVPAGKRLWLKVIADATTSGGSYPEINFYYDDPDHHMIFGVAGSILGNFVQVSGDTMTGTLAMGSNDITTTGTIGASGATLADGVVATTQSPLDDSTQVATTAYVEAAVAAGGGGGANTLVQAYNQGGAGSGRSIVANDGAVEITVEDNGGNVGLIVNGNDVTNNQNAANFVTPDGNTGDTVNISSLDTVSGQALVVNALGAGGRNVEFILGSEGGVGFYIEGNAKTGGDLAHYYSNSGSNNTRSLLFLENDNVAAIGTTPLKTQNDAKTDTNFEGHILMGSNKIWVSDGTTPNGSLTGVAGDVCIAADSGKIYYCTGTTNWEVPATAGVASGYDASVGAGGDYADIQAAITGVGGTDIKLLLIADVTEDSDIVVPSGANLVIDLSSYTLTMGDFQFTYSAAANVFVSGNGVGSGAEIDWTHTVIAEHLFENVSYAGSIVQINDCELDNNSTNAAGTNYVSGAIERMYNLKFYVANQNRGGFVGADDGSFYDNIEFVGGGTDCEQALEIIGGTDIRISNISFTGTYIVGALNDFVASFDGATVTNVMFEHDTDKVAISIADGRITNLWTEGTEEVDVHFSGSGGVVDNANLNGGDIDFAANDNIQLSNVITTGSLDTTDAGSTNCKIVSCRITGAVTIAGDRHKFADCDLLGGVTISSGADDNGFSNCQAGPDGGAGALTITVDSGSNRTRISGCMTDAAIADSGTGTVTAANAVY